MSIEDATLDEIEAPGRDEVAARVAAWEGRVTQLFDRLAAWLPAGFRSDRTQTVIMSEALMRRYDLPSRRLPVLNVHDRRDWRGKVIPSGLFIIGADGRLDVLTRTGLHAIVGAPSAEGGWQITSLTSDFVIAPLDRDRWLDVLA